VYFNSRICYEHISNTAKYYCFMYNSWRNQLKKYFNSRICYEYISNTAKYYCFMYNSWRNQFILSNYLIIINRSIKWNVLLYKKNHLFSAWKYKMQFSVTKSCYVTETSSKAGNLPIKIQEWKYSYRYVKK